MAFETKTDPTDEPAEKLLEKIPDGTHVSS